MPNILTTLFNLRLRVRVRHVYKTPGGGGGGDSPLKWVGGCRWGFKRDPRVPLGAQKIYTPSQYTLLKMLICIPCCNIAHLE